MFLEFIAMSLFGRDFEMAESLFSLLFAACCVIKIRISFANKIGTKTVVHTFRNQGNFH